MSVGTFEGFGGPGGWDEGARILDVDLDIVGIEVDELAATAAVSAGHRRVVQDIREARVEDYSSATGAILSSPCPTFSLGGLGTGRADMQLLLDAITHAGSGCGCDWSEIEHELAAAADPRTALAAQVMRFALQLPNLQWLALEQVAVPAVEYMFTDVAAELMSFDDGADDFEDGGDGGGGHGPGWSVADVFRVDAPTLGLPVRRSRHFLVARRDGGLAVQSPGCIRPGTFPAPTWAQVLGWEPGHVMRTRSGRSLVRSEAKGGGGFSCDGIGWCLTGKARSWERVADGRRLTASEAGLLQGFRRDYPWAGARTRQFQQLGDVVVPPVAAAVLGYATNTPWIEPVRAYLDELYGEQLRAAA